MRRMKIYIYDKENWTDFTWDNKKVMIKLGEARNHQGRLLGRMESLGFDLQNEAVLNTLTLDVIKSSEIEGEFLDIEQVRSSIARRLGIEIAGTVESERHVDGIVEMMLDATQRYDLPLTKHRCLVGMQRCSRQVGVIFIKLQLQTGEKIQLVQCKLYRDLWE
ncbi:MAG: DUF4172 domain-containing protein, partial [Saprospiraceae bacterium]|nr:DUF4172 domain-containing protein [Saprospiraceae bacterium]